MTSHRMPTFLQSSVLIALIIALLGVCILHYELAPQMPIVLSTIIVSLYALWLGFKWNDLEKAMVQGILSGLPSIIILCLIGMLIGIWVLNGTVPTLTFYSLQVLSPAFFLVSATIICCITSVFTGSSWSTLGTVGVALMATAYGMDIPLAMAAGAIVSGAFFGDKMSPLSDTTNLAPAIAGVNIFDHIRHMMWTTIPSMLITLGIFTFLGFNLQSGADTSDQIGILLSTLQSKFAISFWTLLSPLLILTLAVRRAKAIPTLVLGLVVGIITCYFTVPGISFGKIMSVAHFGFTAETGVAEVDKLLSRGGLSSMMFAVSLIMTALAFGGIIQRIGMLDAILHGFKNFLTNRGNVIFTTVTSCLGINILVGEQYLSIVLPGKILAPAYKRVNLHPVNLSRTLEDAGTLGNAIIPWGVSGAFIMSTLGIGMEYVAYSFLCFINPIVAITFGYTGISLKSGQNEQTSDFAAEEQLTDADTRVAKEVV